MGYKKQQKSPKNSREKPTISIIRFRDATGKKESTWRRIAFSPGIEIKRGKIVKGGV